MFLIRKTFSSPTLLNGAIRKMKMICAIDCENVKRSFTSKQFDDLSLLLTGINCRLETRFADLFVFHSNWKHRSLEYLTRKIQCQQLTVITLVLKQNDNKKKIIYMHKLYLKYDLGLGQSDPINRMTILSWLLPLNFLYIKKSI